MKSIKAFFSITVLLLTLPFGGCGGGSKTVYIVGYGINLSNVAYYWENGGAASTLPAPSGMTNAWADAVAVSGSDVYIAGFVRDSTTGQVAAFWENGVVTALPNPTGMTEAEA